jgi:hypothetical protein
LISTSTSHQTPSRISKELLSEISRLEHTTKLLIDVQDLSDLFSEHMIIETASDGGYNPNTGISSFGWVVAVNKIDIAMDAGQWRRIQISLSLSKPKDMD